MAERTDPIALQMHPGGVAVLAMDYRRGNPLTPELSEALETWLARLRHDPAVGGLVLTSAQPHFSVGADVTLLYALESEEEAAALSNLLKSTTAQLSEFPRPVVTAIAGDCLGGGLELALAADGRVAANDVNTRLGLPEVKLGLIPGGGGTQRLVQLVGLEGALPLLLAGRRLNPRQALEVGLIDEAVPQAILVEAAAQRATALFEQQADGWRSRLQRIRDRALAETTLGRRVVFNRAKQQLRKRPVSHYPAPHAILTVVRRGLEEGQEAGLRAETDHFARLAVSTQTRALMEVFLWRQALTQSPVLPHGDGHLEEAARPVRKMGIVGAGLMGSAIAGLSVHRVPCRVRVQDRDANALGEGVAHVHDYLRRQQKRERITPIEARRARARLTSTVDHRGFASCDLVLEAVVEDLEVKQSVLRELEARVGPDTVLATNTSSLPLSELGEGLARPERLVGMHYFSPVERMLLCEVVVGAQTSTDTLATAVQLAHAQGKSVVLVNDGPGFFTTRILAPYLNEAVQLVLEGVSPTAVDRALEGWGFPMGPLALADALGLHTASAVAHILADRLGDRMSPAPELEALVEQGHTGKSAGSGFYNYSNGERRPHENLRRLLGARRVRRRPSRREITSRCVSVMLNEAARCLAQGILFSARDGDAAAVLGLGFPPFRGGPFHTMDRQSLRMVVENLESLQRQHGPRFAPAPILESLAASHGTFHEYVEAAPWQTREPDRAMVAPA